MAIIITGAQNGNILVLFTNTCICFFLMFILCMNVKLVFDSNPVSSHDNACKIFWKNMLEIFVFCYTFLNKLIKIFYVAI